MTAASPAFESALLATGLGFSFSFDAVWVEATAASGRACNVIVSASRATVYVCQHTGCNDGFELARCYGRPEESLPRALAALAAAGDRIPA